MARRPRIRRELLIEAAEYRAAIEFERKLELIHDLDQAQAFAASGPRSGVPSGLLYTNLAYFLRHDFEIPGGAGQSELRLYSRLLRRIEAAGGAGVPPGTADRLDRLFGADTRKDGE